MKNLVLLIICAVFSFASLAQTEEDKATAKSKAREAIKLMDEGMYDESIALLKEGEALDPTSYLYPYEIALAHVFKKEYKKALKILEKTKTYEGANSQIYQLIGNCYSYLEQPEKAIKEYEAGIELFPDAGNLHLEKGNIYLIQEDYNEALLNYERGINAEPSFASNYYWAARIMMSSSDKLSGVIYGEIFMNLERTTSRTQEMSELLLDTYRSSVTLGDNTTSISFCDLVIDAGDLSSDGELELPFCAVFEKSFALSVLGYSEVDLASLVAMRRKFVENFFSEDAEKYPNVLFNYHKEMYDAGVLDAYNYYLFQIGAQEEFDEWQSAHEEEFNQLVAWYTSRENLLVVTDENKYLR